MNVEKYLFKISPTKIKLGLDRTYQLLKACDNPEKKLFTIQLVGSNGKWSTAAMLASILNEKYKYPFIDIFIFREGKTKGIGKIIKVGK